MKRRDELMRKVWKTLEPAGRDLECNFEVDDYGSGVLRTGLINHHTGSAFEMTLSMDDADHMIVAAIVGALKGAWPRLMEPVRWENVR